jgi:type I restriction enzyme S subunit
LNVSVTDFFDTLVVKVPPTKNEEQKITSCLQALNNLINAQEEKISQLELHKKGIIQALFPALNE